MAVGQGALMGDLSYIAVGREKTYGTYDSVSAALGGLAFISASMKTTKETKIIEEISASRTNQHFMQLGKVVEGDLEVNYNPQNNACMYLLMNAFGGGPLTSSATATGETVGGAAMVHTIDVANYEATYSSLCMNMRKGDSIGAKCFEYVGIKVDQLTFAGDIDEPLLMSCSLVCKDSSLTSSDFASTITAQLNLQNPISFANGRISVEQPVTTVDAIVTSTSFWHVQSMEFTIKNNLAGDGGRRLGSDTIGILPAGLAQFEFKATIRFDTSTAYAAMIAGTRMAGQFEFLGDTLSGSTARQGLKITMPYLIISDAGDPEVGGPNDVLTSEVVFAVLRDPTSSGYAVKAAVTNSTQAASYA